jgi:hypothetical protein
MASMDGFLLEMSHVFDGLLVLLQSVKQELGEIQRLS